MLTSLTSYDPLTNTWRDAAPLPTWPRYYHAVGVINDVLYVAGGCRTSDCLNRLSLLTSYNPLTNLWSGAASMPTDRFGLAAGVINNILYVVGGERVVGSSVTLTSLTSYDYRTDTWRDAAPLPMAREHLAAGVINNILYAVGGCGSPTCNIGLTSLTSYDYRTDTWREATQMPTGRSALAVGVIGGKLYAVGGITDWTVVTPPFATIEAYDPPTNTWTTLASMPTARSDLAAGVLYNTLYAVGGYGAGTVALASVEAFTPP